MSSNNIKKLDEFITDTKNAKEKENFWCNSKLSDWKIVKLEEVGRIVNGFAFPIKYQGKKDGKYLFIKVSDMNIAGNEKFIFTSENTIDDALVERLRVRIYPPGTIIFPKIGMVIYLKKVRILAKYGTFDNNLMGIIPNKAIIDTDFLYYYLLGKVDFTRLVGRTTAPSIKKSDIEKLKTFMNGINSSLNIIPYNPVPGVTFRTPSSAALRTFISRLEKAEINYVQRMRRGRGVQGACGQLGSL